MVLTSREIWTLVHGMGLGALFLLAFAGGWAGLWSLRAQYVTAEGLQERMRRLVAGAWIMAITAWLTVLSGTYIVYPWYRAKPVEGADLKDFPRYFLLADPNLQAWHTFGMEWKEHVAFLAPILATVVAAVITAYREQLLDHPNLRRALMVYFTLAFVAAAVAGLFGALITKAAPLI